MNNFNYYAPTKVVFGKDTEKETGRLVKEQGASSVLVHFGGKSAIASGLIDRVCQSLKEEGIAYETLGGVVPNPRLSKVREGIALCRDCLLYTSRSCIGCLSADRYCKNWCSRRLLRLSLIHI